MEKKHYIQIAICSLVILIACAMFNFYYQTYIAPESFVIGSVKYEDYTALPIKDYLSDENVIFSQNINDVTFANLNGTATYEYNFDAKEFNGIEKDYIIYVNDYMINSLEDNAGTVGGTYNLNYYDTEKQVLCASAINIDFSFHSLASELLVTLNSDELGYLMNYFKTDNFIITLAENPYSMMNKDGEVDEKIQEIISLTNKVNELNSEIAGLNTEISQHLQDIAELAQSNEENTAEIERLKTELSAIQAEADNLTTELAAANAELERLETENTEIIAENADLKELIETQKTTISTLEQTISDLQYQVSYYEQLLDEYQNIEKIVVTFRAQDEALKVQLVNKNNYATAPEAPAVIGYTFVGWSVDGENVIDVTTYAIAEDTTFIAVYSNTPGIYNSVTKELTMSWQEMIDKNYLSVTDNILSRGTEYETMRNLVGTLVLDESITTIESNTFRKCIFSEIVLNENLTTIESWAFGETSIRSINIPDSVTTIGMSAFSGCSLLEDVRLSNNVTELLSGTFTDCSINSIEIPNSVTFIGAYCFQNCYLLTNVTIPTSVTWIGAYAFKGCTNLEAAYIPSSVTTMSGSVVGEATFYGCSNVIIYCESETEQSGWFEYWNNVDDTNKHVVKYGYTYEQYLAETSA